MSWQPEPGVRIAAGVAQNAGGFVLAGRSLRESEARTAQIRLLITLAWGATS